MRPDFRLTNVLWAVLTHSGTVVAMLSPATTPHPQAMPSGAYAPSSASLGGQVELDGRERLTL